MIRKAEAKDLGKINELLGEVLEIHAKIRPDIFISGTKKYEDEELLEIFADPESPVFVYEKEGEVLGYTFCQLMKRPHPTNMQDILTLYIDDLCVDEKARGMHIGKALYEYVIDYAKQKGCYNVTLNVWEGNDSARKFYEKVGFGIQKTMMEKIL